MWPLRLQVAVPDVVLPECNEIMIGKSFGVFLLIVSSGVVSCQAVIHAL